MTTWGFERGPRWLVALACQLLASTAVASGNAEQEDAARQMATRAMALIREGKYAEAQRLLEQSYELVPAPTLAVLEGDALMKEGRLKGALRRFEAARRSPLYAHSPPAYRQAVALASRRIQQVKSLIPRLTLVVRGAQVREGDLRIALNGESMSPTLLGIEQRRDPGSYRLVVDEPGGRRAERRFALAPREAETIIVDLREDGVHRGGAEPESVRRTLGFVGVGIGGAGFLVAGIATGVLVDAGNSRRACSGGACPGGEAQGAPGGSAAGAVAVTGLGVGLVSTAIGVTLLLSGEDEAVPPAPIEPYASARTVGVQGIF